MEKQLNLQTKTLKRKNQNEEKPASGQNKVRADIFSGSLAVCLFATASRRGGRKGGLGGIPPAEPIVRNFGSDIFKQTPQRTKFLSEIFTLQERLNFALAKFITLRNAMRKF